MDKSKCDYDWKLGWNCSRWRNHSGPCALTPAWWNFPARWRSFRFDRDSE